MSLPKIPPFNYTPLVKALKEVKDDTRDEATMLTNLHTLILEHTHELSKHYGRIEGLCMLLETAKGRAESGLTEAEIIEYSGERKLAQTYLNLVDKTYFIITQKAKVLTKNA